MKPRRVTHLTRYSCPFGGKKREDEQWIERHPGGRANLASAYEVEPAAADILFLSYHTGFHIERCYQTGAKYGYKLPAQTAMHKELNVEYSTAHARVRHRLLDDDVKQAIFLGIKEKYWIHGLVQQAYTLALTVCFALFFFVQLFHCTFWTRALYGAMATSLSFQVLHVRHHKGRMYQHQRLDALMAPLYDAFMNIHYMFPAQRWIDVHNKSHHIYTNSDEDNDVWMTYPFLVRL